MTTTVEALENAVYSPSNAHAMALAKALAPDPSAWKYRGEVFDLGKEGGCCACGHRIRYAYPVYLGIKSVNIGSECINHYAAIDAKSAEAMQARQTALQEELRLTRLAAAEMVRQDALKAAIARYDAVAAMAVERRDSDYRSRVKMPYNLYRLCASGFPTNGAAYAARKYKSAAAAIKALEKLQAQLESAMAEPSRHW